MKKITYCTLFAALIAFVFAGCKKDKTLEHANVTAVTNLFAPENNKFIKLDPPAGTAVFEWAQAKAEDNGLVLYEVAFDKEDGDFSKPLFILPSDQNGLQNKLTIANKDLNKIAQMAGIQSLATGKLKWTVMSSKGINVKIATESRLIEVERPAGFSEIPADLFATGTATEGGEDLSKAVHFKQTEAGVFEAYTSLKAGTYQLVERNSGTPKAFSITASSNLAEGGTTTVTGDTKVYRIRADFTTATATIDEIVSVGLWFSPDGKVLFDLPYAGKGTWAAEDEAIVFKQESWGRDERYKFRFTVKPAGGEQTTEFFGSRNADNSRPDASTPPAYFDVVPVSSAQYDNSFKFYSGADNNTIDVLLNFGVDTYTHTVTVN
ncbi:hypothetical protein EOD41_03580 [Mucilaginibacter limnophilus]|uniref:SusE outer membrane protein domain-containing protein n=1 Tax=Mucilaginibacter limnophilus TaxID=1932778 RepID=A0A3S2UNT6_9SPHI|nr:SusE domain-containing protein [Mucilaginibacter limnophilus]RVU03029.1 hypothetical protein EOD41_03580 [Mucilaginibacter limnophilus]